MRLYPAPFWSMEYYVAVKIDDHKARTSAWMQLMSAECTRGHSHSLLRRQTQGLEVPKVHPLSFRVQKRSALSPVRDPSFCCVPTSSLFRSL